VATQSTGTHLVRHHWTERSKGRPVVVVRESEIARSSVGAIDYIKKGSNGTGILPVRAEAEKHFAAAGN
jgi:hypothetical protein